MATASTQQPAPAHFTVVDRVVAIPLVHDSLTALHSTLSSYSLTRQPYTLAHTYYSALTSSPYVASTQARLAPVIVRADGLANYAVDVIEKRVPYAFEANTERMVGDLRSTGEHAYGVAGRTIDERLKAPAYGIATGIDQRFTPVVDRFASVVGSLHSKADSPTAAAANGVNGSTAGSDAYQYQRAYRLSLDLKDTLFALSGAQIHQIQEHNGLVQRASETAHKLSALLSSSFNSVSTQIHALSNQMLNELASLQASLAKLPSYLQTQASTSYQTVAGRLEPVIGDMKGVIADKDLPVQVRIGKLRDVVEEKVVPLLGDARASVLGAVSGSKANGKPLKKKENRESNGSATYHEAHEIPARI